MFRIGEFSKLTQVSVRMLRYYDETGLLKPARTDPWTGYRLYSAEQIPALNKIVYLRDSGFSVAEIAMALGSGESRFAAELLDRKRAEIEKNIRLEHKKLKMLETAKNALRPGQSGMCYEVSIRSVASFPVLSLRKTIPNYYAEGKLWQELAAFAAERNIPVTQEAFSIYHDEDYREEDVDVELCAVVKEPGQNEGAFTFRMTEAVPRMACTMVYGDFGNIAGAYLSFARWLQNNEGYGMASPSRQIVHRGPWNAPSPEEYLTEIQIPLKKPPGAL